MEMSKEEDRDLSQAMHVESRREISDIKKNVSNLLEEDFNLRSNMKEVSIKIDKLTERVEKGISQTTFKTFEKVNELAVIVERNNSQMRHDNEKRDLRIASIAKDVNVNSMNNRTVLRWVLGTSSSILVAVMALAVWIIQR